MSYDDYSYNRNNGSATRIATGFLIFIICALSALSLFGMFGGVGKMVKTFLIGAIGYVSYAYCLVGTAIGVFVVIGKKVTLSTDKFVKYLLLFILGILILHVATGRTMFLNSNNYGEYLSACYSEGSVGGVAAGIFMYPVLFVLRPMATLVIFLLMFFTVALISFYPYLKSDVPYKTRRTKIESKPKRPTMTEFGGPEIKQQVISDDKVGSELFLGNINENEAFVDAKKSGRRDKKELNLDLLYPETASSSFDVKSSVKPALSPEEDRKRRSKERLFGKRSENSEEDAFIPEAKMPTVDFDDKQGAPFNPDDKIIFKDVKNNVTSSRFNINSPVLPYASGRDEQGNSYNDQSRIDSIYGNILKNRPSQEEQIEDARNRYRDILESGLEERDIRGSGVHKKAPPRPEPEPEIVPEPEIQEQTKSKKVDYSNILKPMDDLPDSVKRILNSEISTGETNLGRTVLPSADMQAKHNIPQSATDNDGVADISDDTKVFDQMPIIDNNKLMQESSKPTVERFRPLERQEDDVSEKPKVERFRPLSSESTSENTDTKLPAIEDKNQPDEKAPERLRSFAPHVPDDIDNVVIPTKEERDAEPEKSKVERFRPLPATPVESKPKVERFRPLSPTEPVKPQSDNPRNLTNDGHTTRETEFTNNKSVSIVGNNKTSQPKIDNNDQVTIEEVFAAKKVHKPYKAPPISLLEEHSSDIYTEDFSERSQVLEEKLSQFGIDAKVIAITQGPTFSRFEMKMPAGKKVSAVKGLEEDIAMALKAKSVRIEAPIPGKDAFGVEVPNAHRSVVGIKDIINSNEFNNSKSPLTFALGKDIGGANYVCDIDGMPHLLIAGATGSGKSVCINSLVISLLYKSTPEDVKLILVDPKRVELTIFNNMPHMLLKEVISEPDKAINALEWAINEMNQRYILFESLGAKNIFDYNKKASMDDKLQKLPQIVIIIDELADLIMMNKKEIEDKISKLTRLSRAAGIYLVVATQRPSVDYITGSIKANLPSRIAFGVTSFADSKTILDKGGADKLLGMGDMLYAPRTAPDPIRLQGCFVSNDEVTNIVNYVKHYNEADFDETIEKKINFVKEPEQTAQASFAEGEEHSDVDALFKSAVKLVVTENQASVSRLQRKFGLGFSRAARIIDQMADKGYISQSVGNKPREVLITMDDFLRDFGEDADD